MENGPAAAVVEAVVRLAKGTRHQEAEKSRTPVVCRFDGHSCIAVDDTVDIVLATAPPFLQPRNR